MEFSYSRRLNRPLLYFKYFTIFDLFGLVGGVVVVPSIFGMKAYLAGFCLWFAYTLAFRIGRPAGYGHHFFKSMVRPNHYSIGRGNLRRPVHRFHD